MAKRTRGNPIPLVIESHPDGYDGYPFVTLIRYREENHLTIVDAVDNKSLSVFVLDLCGPENVSETLIVQAASEWYENERNLWPISVSFSRSGLITEATKIHRSFNIEYATRVIGPLPQNPTPTTSTTKRRRRKSAPVGVTGESSPIKRIAR